MRRTGTSSDSKMRRLRALVCNDSYERAARARGAQRIAGVDEVGRGAWFGPVVAAAVILPEAVRIEGLRDSKQLTAHRREQLDALIRSQAVAIGVGYTDAAGIDALNIRRATQQAMLAAIAQLTPQPDFLLIDAEQLDTPCAQQKILHGDAVSVSIAAASIVAKVYRDAWLRKLDCDYPQYGLASHKGYGVAAHRKALLEHGPCALHRKSFAPVRALCTE
jgi:ribonuclease HII